MRMSTAVGASNVHVPHQPGRYSDLVYGCRRVQRAVAHRLHCHGLLGRRPPVLVFRDYAQGREDPTGQLYISRPVLAKLLFQLYYTTMNYISLIGFNIAPILIILALNVHIVITIRRVVDGDGSRRNSATHPLVPQVSVSASIC